jgi:hypothetical protein
LFELEDTLVNHRMDVVRFKSTNHVLEYSTAANKETSNGTDVA